MNQRSTWCAVLSVALALALALTGSLARAADHTLTLQPSQDASIFHDSVGGDSLADGGGPYLWLSVTAEGLARRALVQFDLSVVPPGSVVKSVELTLRQSRAREGHDVTIHRLLAAWSEGPASSTTGAGAPSASGDATWMYRSVPGSLWSAVGGDFEAAPSAVQTVGQNTPAFYSWSGQLPTGGGTAPPIVQDVQSWVNTPSANHGWILIGNESGVQNAKRLESRNNSIVSNRPLLTVVYADAAAAVGDVPVPPWALGALALMLIGVGYRHVR